MHSGISNIKRMCGRDRTLSHNGRHNRNIHFLRKFFHQIVSFCNIHTAASQNQWFFRWLQQLICFFQLSDMYTLIRLVSTDLHTLRVFCRSARCLDILWKVDQNRSRLSGARNVECHFNDFSKIFPIPDRHAVLCDASCHSDNVYLLKGIISDQA